MKQLKEVLKTSFDANLADAFSKRAHFEPTMDYVEYVSTDTITVSNRIDPYLTLIYSSEDKKLVGFRLKGIRYVSINLSRS